MRVLAHERDYLQGLVFFLISRGADPWLHDTHKQHRGDGGSAIGIILAPMKEGRARPDGRGSLEKHLLGLFNVLRGWSVPLVYQSERSERDVLQVLGWLAFWGGVSC